MAIVAVATAFAATAQVPPSTPAAPRPALANPASRNCVDQGGTLKIEQNGQGGAFGVCQFDDNRQCEEWALMRGDCRKGGIRVTGYATPAARYCAITGGTYKVTSATNTEREQGICTFLDGKQCDARAYFNATCGPTATKTPRASAPGGTAAAKTIRAVFHCASTYSDCATR